MRTDAAVASFGVDQLSRKSPKSAEETYDEPESESPHCDGYILFILSLFAVAFVLYVVQC
jgi:hypothetical protein